MGCRWGGPNRAVGGSHRVGGSQWSGGVLQGFQQGFSDRLQVGGGPVIWGGGNRGGGTP